MKKPTRLLFAASLVVAVLIQTAGWATHPGTRITGTFTRTPFSAEPLLVEPLAGEPLLHVWQLGCNQAPVQNVMVKNSGGSAIGASIVDVGAHGGKHARFKINISFGHAWFWREGGTLEGVPVACSTALKIGTGGSVNQWLSLVIPSNARWMSVHNSGLNGNLSASWELYVCPVTPPTSTHPCNP